MTPEEIEQAAWELRRELRIPGHVLYGDYGGGAHDCIHLRVKTARTIVKALDELLARAQSEKREGTSE